MGFLENVSKHKLGVRWLMAMMLGLGFVLRRATFTITLASVVYFLVEGHRVRSLAQRHGTSVSDLVASSGWLLRRGFLWALMGLAVLYNVLIAANLVLAIASGLLLYVAGLFAQTARAAECEHRPGGEHRREDEHRPEDEYRPEDDRQPSRTGPTGE